MKKGDVIGDYVVGKRLYRSRHSVVYEAEHQPTGRLDVLKVARASCEEELRTLHENYIVAEGRVLRRLDSPSIVRYKHFEFKGDSAFLFLEKIQGLTIPTLFSRIQATERDFKLWLATYIVKGMLDGLVYLHTPLHKPEHDGAVLTKIIHGDISPENILMCPDLKVKIIDFGLAGYSSHPGSLAQQYFVMKEGYASPERLLGTAITPASDIFSVGSCMAVFLTGQSVSYDYKEDGTVVPCDGALKNIVDVTEGNKPLEELVRASVENDPKKRPTAKEMKKRLDALEFPHSADYEKSFRQFFSDLKKKRMS